MRRREFIVLLGSAAVWPATGVAQQNNKKLIGFITGFNDKEVMPLFATFRARLQELGWIEGQNTAFDIRTTSGDYAKLDTEADSLVATSPDVIVAQGTASLTSVRRYTRTIPVVFNQVSDPVGQRLINSLARPGGNATGLTNFEFASGTKWFELLTEFDPTISHVTLITNPANENTAQFVKVITAAGDAKKVTTMFRRTAEYVDKILKGTRPADMPVEQPTIWELVINLKTAKALGANVPPTLVTRADVVIE
jgi:putative ABC transport system substrate-binding protein